MENRKIGKSDEKGFEYRKMLENWICVVIHNYVIKTYKLDFLKLLLFIFNLPLDSRTSEVSLIVNGKSVGTIALNPFSAKAPWPISLLWNGAERPISFVAYGGNS